MTRLNSPGEQAPANRDENQDGAQSSEQNEGKFESSQSKSLSSNSEDSAHKPIASQSGAANKEQISRSDVGGDIAPSVQGGDENQSDNKPENADQMIASGSSSISQISPTSSLKTVELEIPASENSVNPMTAGSSSVGQNQGSSFNSVRLSNIDLSDNIAYNAAYENKQDANVRQLYKQGSLNSQPEQIIQPRESQQSSERRDKSEDSNIEAMVVASKSRFGARSQPQSSVQVAPTEQPAPANHQLSSAVYHETTSNSEGSDSLNSDKLLVDRSDDSASLAEIASSANNEPSSSPGATGQGMAMSIDEISSVDPGNGGKVRPVVGTDELASGPIQIEDRIGSAAQESLESTLSKLQQQIPQTAALISSSSNQQPQNQLPDRPASEAEQRVDSQQTVPKSDKLDNERSDVTGASSQPKQQNDNLRAQSNHKAGPNYHREVSQPYPNVMGQAKVISDPNSGLGARGVLLTQSSNTEGQQIVATANQSQKPNSQNEQPTPTSKQPEPQPSLSSKPIAQVTNVPINIGFPQSQIPAIQQLSQQIAYFQQQQQQQQQQSQQQPKSTPKPARSRFNLLSPQAALQAVASRFLSKPTMQPQPQLQSQPQQTQQPLPVSQQIPQLMKLSVDQQQKLFAQMPALQQQAHKFLLPPGPQQFPLNRFASPQQPLGTNLVGRLNNGQQPLVRSRRSAILPSKRGNGELGMAKTFMVVTGMDLAFAPNSTEIELPPILEGKRMIEDEVIYGVCMPVVSLTFVLTCAFWLIVFIFSFCIYTLIKSRRYRNNLSAKEEIMSNPSL